MTTTSANALEAMPEATRRDEKRMIMFDEGRLKSVGGLVTGLRRLSSLCFGVVFEVGL